MSKYETQEDIEKRFYRSEKVKKNGVPKLIISVEK